MQNTRFLNFPVYKDSKRFFAESTRISQSFPRVYYELGDQLRRASLSVCLNIAEGSAKYSDKEFHRFLEIAMGSINESLACFDIALDHKLIETKQFENLFEQAISIAKQLGGLEKYLRKR